MPTPLTHAVVGAGLATFLAPSRHRATAALALGALAASPDLDRWCPGFLALLVAHRLTRRFDQSRRPERGTLVETLTVVGPEDP